LELPLEEVGSFEGEVTIYISPIPKTKYNRMGPKEETLELHDDQLASSTSFVQEEARTSHNDQVYSTANE
jgi:hypothetical protein